MLSQPDICAVADMKITKIVSLNLGEFPNVLWVCVSNDAGQVGLGETYFGSGAVTAYLHETLAPQMLGQAAEADFLVVFCALTPETSGLIDETVLASMRPSAVIINVARVPSSTRRRSGGRCRRAGSAVRCWTCGGRTRLIFPSRRPRHGFHSQHFRTSS
jgi:hypothetical protein